MVGGAGGNRQHGSGDMQIKVLPAGRQHDQASKYTIRTSGASPAKCGEVLDTAHPNRAFLASHTCLQQIYVASRARWQAIRSKPDRECWTARPVRNLAVTRAKSLQEVETCEDKKSALTMGILHPGAVLLLPAAVAVGYQAKSFFYCCLSHALIEDHSAVLVARSVASSKRTQLAATWPGAALPCADLQASG